MTQAQLNAEEVATNHGAMLLDLVKRSLAHGCQRGQPPAVNVESFPPPLQTQGATFVTLEKDGRLRGCIGSLQAHQPLVQDLVQNAFRAAFKDPRFPPLSAEELDQIHWSISILSTPEQMLFRDEADLLGQLKPGVDGLIISDAGRRSTFLPQVWEQIPEPQAFLAQLKRKAGLAADHWSPTFQAFRYGVVKIG